MTTFPVYTLVVPGLDPDTLARTLNRAIRDCGYLTRPGSQGGTSLAR